MEDREIQFIDFVLTCAIIFMGTFLAVVLWAATTTPSY